MIMEGGLMAFYKGEREKECAWWTDSGRGCFL
jgi:hypothetical protein